MIKFIKKWKEREDLKLKELREINKKLGELTDCIDKYRGEKPRILTGSRERY